MSSMTTHETASGSQPANPVFRTLFVIGLGRSGSTLLGRLLNNHTGIVNVGELLRLEYVVDKPEAKCACGLTAHECKDWNALLEGIPDEVRRDYRKWTPALLDRMRMNAGASVLVDVSKTRGYRLAAKWKNPEVGFILLFRDPRGILRSFVADGGDLPDQLKRHHKWIRRYEKFARKNRDRCFVMHYEDLMSSPEQVMRSLCGFIGVDYQPAMITPGSSTSHMALYSGSPYMRDAPELRLDERWRTQMPKETIDLITRKLGSLRVYRERYGLGEKP